jgi:putative chitobiose transport system substrate-binding protein
MSVVLNTTLSVISRIRRALRVQRVLHGMAFLLTMAVSTGHAAQTQIQFWTMQLSPFHDAYIKGVIQDFERQYPDVRVQWVDVPWSEMEKKTLTAVAAASAKKPAPDVVNLNPQFASKLAEFGALADPEKFLSAAEVQAFVPAAWRANYLDGKSFALPWYLTTNIVLYNKSLLAEAGVAPPTTHDELLIAARKIRAQTSRYAYFPAIDGSTPLETLVSMGAPLLTENGCRAGFINDSGRRVLSYYRDFYRDNLVPKNVVTEGHRKSVEMFLSGQIAMVTTGMQFLQFIKNNNPQFYREIGVVPQLGNQIINKAGGETVAPANIAAMNVAVLEKSDNKAAAFRFAQFLTNAKNQLDFAKRVPILPSSRASYDDAFFREPTDDALLNAARKLSVEQVLKGAVLVPPMRKYNRFRSDYSRNLQAVMLNRKTVDEALADIDITWQKLLDCDLRLPSQPATGKPK